MTAKIKDYAMFRREKAMISITCPMKFKNSDDIGMFINGALHNPTTGRIDWDNKVCIKLSPDDCADILHGMKFQEKVSIYHQFGQKAAQTIELVFGTGSVTLIVTRKEHEGKPQNRIFINVLPKEFIVIERLLTIAIPMLLGWKSCPETPTPEVNDNTQ